MTRLLRLALVVALLAGGLAALPVVATAAPPAGFSDTQVAAYPAPTGIAFTADGRILAASQRGLVRVIKNGVVLGTALDLSATICTNSERGILGIAVDPNAGTHWVYLFYTPRGSSSCATTSGEPASSAQPYNRVSRFTLNDATNTIDPASELVLLDGIYSPGGYHNAGDLKVGKDGYLYVSTGDGGCDYAGNSGCGGANDASRDRNILNGKILRITTSGGIPSTNPFTGAGTARCNVRSAAAGQICQETWAWGLRNPFRFGFDPNSSGTVFRVNDVGQNVWEEIDQGTKGADYGWNAREGHCQNTDSATDCGSATPVSMTDPVYDYPHTTVGGLACGSITGAAYVPNGVWPAAYSGAYLFGDYNCGAIFALSPANVRTTLVSGLGASSAVAMAFGPDGATQSLYYTTYAGGGELRKLTYTGAGNRAPTASFTATPTSGAVPLDVAFDGSASSDPDGGTLSYRWSFGDGTADVTTSTATTTHRYVTAGRFTARLTVTDPAGLTGTTTATLQPGDRAPSVTITSPTATQQFVVGGRYTLTGAATDPEDGALPASALSWTVIKHHDQHTHPFFGPVSGNNIAITGPAPEDLDAAQTSYLEIRLTVTDSAGVSTTVTRTFNPAKVPVTLATTPAGRTVTVNGVAVTGPTTVTSWQGYQLALAVPAQTDAAGIGYGFGSWSDGGTASHSYTTPAAASTVTATLKASPSAPQYLYYRQGAATSVTLSWSAPASSGASAVTAYTVARDGTDSSGAGFPTQTLASTARSFTFSKLVPGRIYTLSVSAANASARGPVASLPVTVAGPGLPSSPRTVTVRATTAGSASISWTAPASTGGSAITGYRVSRNGVDSQGVGAYSTVVSAGTTSYTMTRLVSGRIYELSVQAVTAAGNGPVASGGVAATTSTAVGSPSSFGLAQSGSVATLTWQAPVLTGGQTITGYLVTRDGTDSAGNKEQSITLPADARTYAFTRLVSGSVYQFTVSPVVSDWIKPRARGSALTP